MLVEVTLCLTAKSTSSSAAVASGAIAKSLRAVSRRLFSAAANSGKLLRYG